MVCQSTCDSHPDSHLNDGPSNLNLTTINQGRRLNTSPPEFLFGITVKVGLPKVINLTLKN